MGSLTATGLGTFLSAGVDPVYDPMLVQGLQITEQAITHVANGGAEPGHPQELRFSCAGNMGLWADWVRASLYLTDFMRHFDWSVGGHDKCVSLSYGGKSFYTIHRPDIAVFEQQLKLMRNYLDQRPDRTPEILTQLGFPTPYFVMLLGLQTGTNNHTFELITITQVIAAHVAMVAKHHLACRRPDRIGHQVMPMIPTPAHGSFPSAHATEAFAVAEVLNGLVEFQSGHYGDYKKRQALINKLAERIAVNRTVAGLHFPIDSWAGAILGRAIGQIVLAKCGRGDEVQGYSYDAHDGDFSLTEFAKGANDPLGVKKADPCSVSSSDLFRWLWDRVCDEYTFAR
ncbi:phosphatase PAP2 family protein [Bradyrhizobium sp. ORS 285]|uniref:phosphatase PAP2 family protein n=1 Tax=Bradyrhizobium sp. ORS 285 TaxID=115808 RepID=UPI001FCB0BCD|nr:phosphatase PAP2 family protein [Bradyrhizobium sp. ORS 285]